MAEAGDVTSQSNLGFMYHDGLGVRRDHAEAAKWFRMAAEKGGLDAQYYMGEMALGGVGVKADPVEAANGIVSLLIAAKLEPPSP